VSLPERVEAAKWTFFAYVERGKQRPSSLKKGNQMFHERKGTQNYETPGKI